MNNIKALVNLTHENKILSDEASKKDKIILELENENAELRVYKRLWRSLENCKSYKS
jgi:hypothetical protein